MSELATFGAGCFWGVESTFRKLKGVIDTKVGYAGGNVENPSYQQVCSNSTGHAEVVQVLFDPNVIDYDALLEVFWACHNPSSLNRQGYDIGSQYRSVIFYHNEEQHRKAIASKHQLEQSGRYSHIVTEIQPAPSFYLAEEYHQRYHEKNS